MIGWGWRAGHGESGFVLAATLWLLAILALAAGSYAGWIHKAMDEARARLESVEALVDQRSTRAVLLFLASTRERHPGGLSLREWPDSERSSTVLNDPFVRLEVKRHGSVLRLDGTPYRGIGKALFTVQDEGGLMNPLRNQRDAVDRFLGELGVEAADRGPLIDKLADYIDQDELRRLQGAEARAYASRGVRPPPNRDLLSAMEALRILDWSGEPLLWRQARWRELVTVGAFGGINLNTSPALVLHSDPGMTSKMVDAILEARQEQPFMSVWEAFERTGAPVISDPFRYTVDPSDSLRITLWIQGYTQGMRYHIRLTPQSDEAPWRIEQAYSVDRYGIRFDEPRSVKEAVFSAAPISGAA